MLNLPPQPGVAGAVMLALGAVAGLLFLVFGRTLVLRDLDDRVVGWVVAGALAATIAGAPFTLWRVVEDIRATVSIGPEHARYVGAETKLIDGELVQRVGAQIPEDDSYYVTAAPDAFSELRASVGLWFGYALIPRRRVTDREEADWIVTWGATPAELGVDAGPPRLVGRNRLVENEPVYLAPAHG